MKQNFKELQFLNNKTQYLFILGIGRWSENRLFSFTEDTCFPFPFFHKVKQDCNIEERANSWRRRVDVNVISYFTVIIIFSVMNIIYATLVSYWFFYLKSGD